MFRRSSALVAAWALVLAAAPLLAQGKPQTRQGFNISFGIGGGSAGYDCDGCEDLGRETGTTMFLHIGGTVTPQLTVGGELNGWGKSSRAEDSAIGSAMAVVHYYPILTQGLFLSGGAGFTSLAIRDKTTFPDDEMTSDGFGVQVGVGYDWRVGRNFSLTPYAQYVRAFAGEAEFNGTSTGSDLNPNFFQIGLGFTWH